MCSIRQTIPSVIVGSGEGRVYADLTSTLGVREAVFDRPLAHGMCSTRPVV